MNLGTLVYYDEVSRKWKVWSAEQASKCTVRAVGDPVEGVPLGLAMLTVQMRTCDLLERLFRGFDHDWSRRGR